MNRITYLALVALLLLCFSCDDTELGEPVGSNYFFKLYGSFYNDFANSVVEDSNNGLLIAGYSQNDVGQTWAYMSKVSANGMLEWDTTLFANKNSKAFDIYNMQSLNKVYVACGQEFNEDSTWISLLGFSNDGVLTDSISTKVLASDIKSIQIIYQNDGSLRLLSQITRIESGTKRVLAYLLIHDLTVDSLLEENFNIQLNQQIAGQILVKYSTEQIIYMAATVYESELTEDFTPPTDIRILQINNNSVVWDRIYGEVGISETCSDLIILNNSLIVSGNHRGNGAPQAINVLTTSMAGVELSNYVVQVDDVSSNIACESFTVNNSGNYVFCGNIETGTGTADILFLETSFDGTNINSVTYGSTGVSTGRNNGKSIHFIQHEDAYLMTGEMETINNFDICIFKLNQMGSWIQ